MEGIFIHTPKNFTQILKKKFCQKSTNWTSQLKKLWSRTILKSAFVDIKTYKNFHGLGMQTHFDLEEPSTYLHDGLPKTVHTYTLSPIMTYYLVVYR